MITPPSRNSISGGLKQHDHHCHLIVLWCDKPECGCQTEEPQDARDLAFCALEFEPHSMASATSCWHSLVDIMLVQLTFALGVVLELEKRVVKSILFQMVKGH